MKIVFMGTPEFSVQALELLIKNHDVVAVVTQPDKQKGRGKKFVYSPVKETALKYEIPVFQPEKIRNTDFLRELDADIFIVVAYGQILSEEILNIPKYGCVNVHASLLPKYRGAAPIQWAIINGEKQTGVTIMYMVKALDAGDMILKRTLDIEPDDTSETLHQKLSVLGAEALIEALVQIENNTAMPEKQNDAESTYAKMIDKSMGLLDFNKTSREIINLINGLNPWPSAYTFYSGEMLKIWKAQIINGYDSEQAGQIVDVNKQGFVIKTKDTAILVTEVQGMSSKRMRAADFLRGHQMLKGEFLGRE